MSNFSNAFARISEEQCRNTLPTLDSFKLDPEFAPRPKGGLDTNVPTEAFHIFAHDCQTNARPFVSSADAFEHPKDPLVVLRLDSNAIVLNADSDAAARGKRAYSHVRLRAWGDELHRIGQKI